MPDTVGLFAALSSYNIAILYSAVLWQPVLAVDEVRVSMGTILLMANVKHTIVVISNNYILSKYFYSLTPIFMVSTKCIDPWVLEFMASNTTGNNQWGNSISLDFNVSGLSGPQNPRKLEPHD